MMPRAEKPSRSRRLDILGSALLDSQGAVASHRASNYPVPVSGVEEIKQAIDKLSFKERCELMAVLAPPAYDEWDRQMLSDSEPGGKLDRLKERAHEEYQAGKCTEWPPREVPRSS
jgi:hypothetical protein